MTTDYDFHDTMVMPRRQTMPFEPASYRAAKAAMCKADACRQGRDACATPEACRLAAEDADADSEFGALEGLVHGRRAIGAAWAIIAATAVAAYLIWW